MAAAGTVYLVVRRDNGFGDVFPLTPESGQGYTLGRATTNRIVLKDELCSREHAEIYHSSGRWRVRDLDSLNGSRLNGDRLTKETDLAPGDEVHLGRTTLMFVEDMEQLPDLPSPAPPSEGMSIKKRLGQTRFLTPVPEPGQGETRQPNEVAPRHTLSRDLALLYRLALEMGSAGSLQGLAVIVLDGLLEATRAEVGALLLVSATIDLEAPSQLSQETPGHASHSAQAPPTDVDPTKNTLHGVSIVDPENWTTG